MKIKYEDNDIFLHFIVTSYSQLPDILSGFLENHKDSLEINPKIILNTFHKNLEKALKEMESFLPVDSRSLKSFQNQEEFDLVSKFLDSENIPSPIKYIFVDDILKNNLTNDPNICQKFLYFTSSQLEYLNSKLILFSKQIFMPAAPYKRTRGILLKLISSNFITANIKSLLQSDYFYYQKERLIDDFEIVKIIKEVKTEIYELNFKLEILKLYILFISNNNYSLRSDTSVISEKSLSTFPYIESEFLDLVEYYIVKFNIHGLSVPTSRKTIRRIIAKFFE